MVGLQLANPKQWATSNFEQHLNGGSSIVKSVCLICIHPSCEHATILVRKIYIPNSRVAFDIPKNMFCYLEVNLMRIVHKLVDNVH